MTTTPPEPPEPASTPPSERADDQRREPTGNPRVDAVLDGLNDIETLEPAEQVRAFDAMQRALAAELDVGADDPADDPGSAAAEPPATTD